MSKLAQLMNSSSVLVLQRQLDQLLKGRELSVMLAAASQLLVNVGEEFGEADLHNQDPCPIERGANLFQQLMYQEGWRVGQVAGIAASLMISALAQYLKSRPQDEAQKAVDGKAE